MPSPNPYEPTVADNAGKRKSISWIRLVIALNLVLVAISVSGAVYAYMQLRIELAEMPDSNGNGPVIYEIDFIGIFDLIWPILKQFALPNAMLLIYLVTRRYSERRSNTP